MTRFLDFDDYKKSLFNKGIAIRLSTDDKRRDSISVKLEEVDINDTNYPPPLAGGAGGGVANIVSSPSGGGRVGATNDTPYFKSIIDIRKYKNPEDPSKIETLEEDGCYMLSKSGAFRLQSGAILKWDGCLHFQHTFQPLAKIIDNYHISTNIMVEEGGVLEVQGDVWLGKKVTVTVHEGGRLVMQDGAQVTAGTTIEVQPGETKTVGAGLRPAP
jgi:hypothetical protein